MSTRSLSPRGCAGLLIPTCARLAVLTIFGGCRLIDWPCQLMTGVPGLGNGCPNRSRHVSCSAGGLLPLVAARICRPAPLNHLQRPERWPPASRLDRQAASTQVDCSAGGGILPLYRQATFHWHTWLSGFWEKGLVKWETGYLIERQWQ